MALISYLYKTWVKPTDSNYAIMGEAAMSENRARPNEEMFKEQELPLSSS